MTDKMNADWAYELLREAAGIYLSYLSPHLAEGGDELVEVFIAGGERALARHVDASNRAAQGLGAQWPDMPDLDGEDMFGHLPIVGE